MYGGLCIEFIVPIVLLVRGFPSRIVVPLLPDVIKLNALRRRLGAHDRSNVRKVLSN